MSSSSDLSCPVAREPWADCCERRARHRPSRNIAAPAAAAVFVVSHGRSDDRRGRADHSRPIWFCYVVPISTFGASGLRADRLADRGRLLSPADRPAGDHACRSRGMTETPERCIACLTPDSVSIYASTGSQSDHRSSVQVPLTTDRNTDLDNACGSNGGSRSVLTQSATLPLIVGSTS